MRLLDNSVLTIDREVSSGDTADALNCLGVPVVGPVRDHLRKGIVLW